jgi:polysaccharide export outer membrane protein
MKTIKFFAVLFVVIIFLLNVSGSKTFGQATENAKPIEKGNSATEKKIAPATIEASQNSAIQKNADPINNQDSLKGSSGERYRIGYQDSLEVQIFRHPELSQIVSVNPDGTIYLPRLEAPVVAVCKTERELVDTLTALYKNYLRNPFINVRLSEQKSQGFSVIGAVQKPGTFYLNRRVHLLELLSLAGGQDVEFAGGKIQIARIGNVAGCRENVEAQAEKDDIEFVSLSLKDVLEGKQNPLMQPGDIISVLKSEEAYVVGKVFKPAKVALDEPKTLRQAIAAAGGLDSTAKTSKVVIRRQATGNSPQTDLVYNLKDIEDKKIPDPQLQANDIVEVGTDKFKTVRNGLIKALTGGLGNIFYRFP